jgi:hypothetical protein
MGDLRANATRMRELLEHLLERESAFPHFYCDDRGLVTIAIGYLVDQAHASDDAGKRLARQLASRGNVTFMDARGMGASLDDVEHDWTRVKQYGRSNPRSRARDYARVAQLRIGRAAMFTITESVVTQFIDQLYVRRPFVMNYDPRIAMAFVDVRYNAAGVALYSNQGPVQQMWDALNPHSRAYDLNRAMTLFEQIWANRGADRYGVRHYMRAKWMRAGLLASGGELAPQSVI